MPSNVFANLPQNHQPQLQNKSPLQILGDLRNLAGELNGKDPEQVARQMAKQRGISDNQLNDLFGKAKEMAGIFNGLGMHL